MKKLNFIWKASTVHSDFITHSLAFCRQLKWKKTKYSRLKYNNCSLLLYIDIYDIYDSLLTRYYSDCHSLWSWFQRMRPSPHHYHDTRSALWPCHLQGWTVTSTFTWVLYLRTFFMYLYFTWIIFFFFFWKFIHFSSLHSKANIVLLTSRHFSEGSCYSWRWSVTISDTTKS